MKEESVMEWVPQRVEFQPKLACEVQKFNLFTYSFALAGPSLLTYHRSSSTLTVPQENQFFFLLYLRHHFKHPSQGGGIKKRDFSAVDYMIRRGHRMIDQVFREKGATSVVLPREVLQEMQERKLAEEGTRKQ